MVYKDINIILVEPLNPENIGFCARSMDVFGFYHLVLIKPKLFSAGQVIKTAVSSNHIIKNSVIYNSFDDIKGKYDVLVGTTRRLGAMRYPVYTPEETAVKLENYPDEAKIGLLFGREDKGLYNDELDYCDMISSIPSYNNKISLNLSHAVTIYIHELFKSFVPVKHFDNRVCSASNADTFKLMELCLNLLKDKQFIKYGEKSLKSHLSNLIKRCALEKKDVKLLESICYHLAKKS